MVEVVLGVLFVAAVFVLGVCVGGLLWYRREGPVLARLVAESNQQRAELDQLVADTHRELAARAAGVSSADAEGRAGR